MPLFISKRAKTQHERGEGSRIPASLQAVFLTSNRGADVVKPPPRKSAMRIFFTPKTWLKGGNGTDKNTKGKNIIPANRKSSKKDSIPSTVSCKMGGVPDGIAVPSQRVPSKKKAAPMPKLTPQQYLESLLRTRGYSTEYFSVLDSAYYNKPTPLQEASYGVYIVDVVRRNDDDALQALLALGIHPNACNSYGESIVHLACRRGNYQSLQTMIDFHCNIQVADDYGRTPLHDLCWASEPSFLAAAMVLEIDPRLLFLKDARGSAPLAYARREHWADWIKFLESRKDEYWPKRGKDFQQGPPTLTKSPANSRPLTDPENALSLKLTLMVASGKMKPEEAELLRHDSEEDAAAAESALSREHSDDDDEDDDDDGSASGSDEDEDVDSEDDSVFDIEEMADIVGTIQAIKCTR